MKPIVKKPFISALSSSIIYVFISISPSLGQNQPELTSSLVEPKVVEVRTGHDHMNNRHRFELSTREVPSGWTTFKLINTTSFDHFMALFKIPQQAIQEAENQNLPVLEIWENAITKPFQKTYDPYIRGEMEYDDFVENLVAGISEKGAWFFDPGAPPMGGAGFTASGNISMTTVNLEPGKYLVECYVKDENEMFHSYLGMIDLITVEDNSSQTIAPSASAKVSISSSEGIKVVKPVRRGENVVEIYFEDQSSYEHLLGHNVQLVKMGNSTDDEALKDLAEWMDWTQPGSLADRAPHGFKFMGGTMQMQEGGRSYFHVDLPPGRYAWIAEVPDPQGKKMFVPFSVK